MSRRTLFRDAVPALALLSLLASACATTAGVQNNHAGLIHFRHGRFSEAESEFKAAAKANPKNAIFINNLGLANFAQGRVDEAIASYQKAIALDDRNALFHRCLGDAYHAQGKLAEALQQYQTALARSAVEPVHVAIINVAFDMGKADEWVKKFADAMKDTKPEGSEAISKVFLAEQAILHAYELQGRTDELIARAAKDIEAIRGVKKEEGGHGIPIITSFLFFMRAVPKRQINTAPIVGSLYVYRGRGYLKKGMDDEARADFRTSSEVAPAGWGGAYLGIAALKANDTQEAVFQLRKALETRPNWISGRLYYAAALKMNGDSALAEKERETAARLAANRRDLTLPSAYEHSDAEALAATLWESGPQSK